MQLRTSFRVDFSQWAVLFGHRNIVTVGTASG